MNGFIISLFIVYVIFPLFIYIYFKLFDEKKIDEQYRKMSKSWK